MRDQSSQRKPGGTPSPNDTRAVQDRRAGATKHKKLIGKWLSRPAFEKLTGRPGKAD